MFQIGRAGHNNNILKKAHLKRAARFGWVGGSSRERERERSWNLRKKGEVVRCVVDKELDLCIWGRKQRRRGKGVGEKE